MENVWPTPVNTCLQNKTLETSPTLREIILKTLFEVITYKNVLTIILIFL